MLTDVSIILFSCILFCHDYHIILRKNSDFTAGMCDLIDSENFNMSFGNSAQLDGSMYAGVASVYHIRAPIRSGYCTLI